MSGDVKPGYKQTEVGVIPEDWEIVLLDSVAKRGSGHTPNKKHPEYWGGQIKWVSLQDSDRLDHLFIYDTAATITPAGIANSSATMHPAGTVVLSRDAGVGKSAIMKCDMAVSQHFMAWKCGSKLNNHFLYYWLQSRKAEFERIAMGSTIKTIGLSYFKQLAFPLPKLGEQEAIAEALSDADALIESLTQLIAKKRQIKQGAMQELLTGKRRLHGFANATSGYKQTEVGVIPDDWSVIDVAGVTLRHKQGFYTKDRYVENGTRLVRITDLMGDRIDFSTMPMLKISQLEFDQFKIDRGDFLFARSGAIGRYGIVHSDIEAVFGSYIIRFVFDPNKISNEYFGYLYQTSHVWKQLLSITQGSSNININAGNIKALKIPLPTTDEQNAITIILLNMDAEITALETKLAKARQLKQGMMHNLLTGRIRLV